MTQDLLDLPVVALAERLRSRALSPVALLDAHIARLLAVNPSINAITAERFDLARAEAQRAETRLRQPDPPPLTGIPCTIKEFVAVQGMPWTGGLMRRKDVKATEDAPVVQRLRAAGAIVMATSNAPEGGLWMETYNDLYGRTSNPWDLKRSPGGSSGGEGALVSSGASPFGIGSDVGGSIRIPAAFCGVFGHKPSGLMVPNTGHFPPGMGGTEPYLCVGPLGRSVADLALLMGILAGPDGQGKAHRRFVHNRNNLDLKTLRVVPLETNGRVSVRRPVRQAVRRAADALAARGARIDERPIPGLARAFEIWTAMLSEAADEHYDTILTGGPPLKVFQELVKLPFGKSNHTFAALALTAGDKLTAPFSGAKGKLVEEGRKLQAEIEAMLGPDGVLLHPPYSRPAPRHRDSWRTPLDAQYTAIFNVLEFPVTVVPAGFESRGLPLAVQVVGGRGQDSLTLAVAAVLERDLGGWVRSEPRQG